MKVVSGTPKMSQVEIGFRKAEIHMEKETPVSDGTESLCVC